MEVTNEKENLHRLKIIHYINVCVFLSADFGDNVFLI